MIWKVIGACLCVFLAKCGTGGGGGVREQQGARGGGASFPLDAFEGISASRAEPDRHVRVMRVMGSCAAEGQRVAEDVLVGIINCSAD